MNEDQNLPPHVVANLEAINRAARNHPALFKHASSIVLSQTGKPTIHWWKFMATQDEMISLVRLFPEAGWKPKPSRTKGDFDYVAEIDGVIVELEAAESVAMVYAPAKVDLSKLKLSTER